MDENSRPTLLYAFHDFRVTWPCFDYIGFLVTAEWTRREIGADGIHVVFVPQQDDEFHKNHDWEFKQKKWRLNNLVIPISWMLPSCKSISVCSSSEEARKIFDKVDGAIFPDGYTIDKPNLKGDPSWPALLANMGADIQYLKSSSQALDYIRSWKEAKCNGQKLVSITIRDANYNQLRNSDLGLWSSFAQWLKNEGYYPVIIPDTDTALEPLIDAFDGIDSLPPAAFNIELRMALYEESFLSTFVSNGPAYMCCFNKNVHILQFRTGEFLTDPTNIESFQGISHGTNPPYLNQFQRSVWRELNIDVLRDEFSKMSSFLGQCIENGSYKDRLKPDIRNREPVLKMAKRFYTYQNWEPLDGAFEWLMKTEADNPELWQLVGLANEAKNRHPDAANLHAHQDGYEKAISILEKNDTDRLDINSINILTDCLGRLGRFEEAEKVLRRRLEIDDANLEIYLQLIQNSLGLMRQEISAMEANLTSDRIN